MSQPDATVIIPARNAAGVLPKCLSHLEQQAYPAARFEILVVDAGSSDETRDLLARHASGAPVRTRVFQIASGTEAAARNAGLREALGRRVLFLEPDLIAGPRWLERHLAIHEQSPVPVFVSGAIQLHPQLDAGVLTRWFLPEERGPLTPSKPFHFLDCQDANCSGDRDMFVEAGGFSEDPDLRFCGGEELASRLVQREIPVRFTSDACAYAWRPVSFDAERQRQYAAGRSMHALSVFLNSSDIARRFWSPGGPLQRAVERLVHPFYVRACQQGREDPRVLALLYRRVLRRERRLGFWEAYKGRTPRFPWPDA